MFNMFLFLLAFSLGGLLLAGYAGLLWESDEQQRLVQHFLRGNELLRQGRAERAVREYDRALSVLEDPAILYNRAAAHMQCGRMAHAAEDCTRALQIDPRYERAHVRRAQALHEMGDTRAAIEDLMHVVDTRHTHADREEEEEKRGTSAAVEEEEDSHQGRRSMVDTSGRGGTLPELVRQRRRSISEQQAAAGAPVPTQGGAAVGLDSMEEAVREADRDEVVRLLRQYITHHRAATQQER